MIKGVFNLPAACFLQLVGKDYLYRYCIRQLNESLAVA
jgi:hypothetical protein